ncbi:MAG TPA: DNA polymerase III subunit delta' [Steroidobacteraceae bacterium]|nr:DNA polymerase III subunit delta' [Steroidobacteraceae bacterium]
MSGAALAWLTDPLRSLTAAHAAQRMPHALLVVAAPGTGGEWLASWAAQLVLCTGRKVPSAGPCAQCPACRQVAERRHPDLLWVQPAEDSQQIRIEQVRELSSELALTSHQGGYKVAVLSPADALNRFAANALLKTLEEPAARTLLVLVAAEPSRLPATLLSRCQRVRVRAPTREQSLEWLRATRGQGDWAAVLDVIGEAPLAATELDPALVARVHQEIGHELAELSAGRADATLTAERWSRSELPLRLTCIENWLTEHIRRGAAAGTQDAELRASAHSGARESVFNTRALFQALDGVRELRAALGTGINRSLVLESLLRSLGS